MNAEVSNQAVDQHLLNEAIHLTVQGLVCERMLLVRALTAARRRLGLSREALAEQTGIALAHLTRIEMGDHAIAAEEQHILASALQVPIALLEPLGPLPAIELHAIPLQKPDPSRGVLVPWPSRPDLRLLKH